MQAKEQILPFLAALAEDNTVLECNLSDCEEAFRAALQELRRLKAEEASLVNLCAQARHMHEHLSREVQARERLREEGEKLAAKNAELRAVLLSAAEAEEEDSTALLQSLVQENTLLRKLLFEGVSFEEACTASSCPSWLGGRSPGGSEASGAVASEKAAEQ